MKTCALYIVHYGVEYLGYSIKSVYDSVDKIFIFYTQHPSHGRKVSFPCPETEGQIKEAAYQFGDPDDKIMWKKGWWSTEGQQRSAGEEMCQAMGYNVVVVSDYDEVWDKQALNQAIQYVKDNPFKRYRVPMIHFWKDFNTVCKDLAQPVRFVKFSGDGEGYVPLERPVWHFGYAISDEIMKYKWEIHGHFDELRPDWFEKVWLGGRMTDVHPTNLEDFWTPEHYFKEQLPEFMQLHPRYDKDK